MKMQPKQQKQPKLKFTKLAIYNPPPKHSQPLKSRSDEEIGISMPRPAWKTDQPVSGRVQSMFDSPSLKQKLMR